MSEPPRPDAGSPGEPTAPPPVGGGDAWSAWAAALADTVQALADGETVTLTASEEAARPVLLRRARLAGMLPARHDVVVPWVRLQRVEDHLRGHCVGSVSVGGAFPCAPDEDAALLALGWHRPGAGDGPDYVRFWPDDVAQAAYLPREEAQRAVAVVAATFRDVLDRGGDPPNVTRRT